MKNLEKDLDVILDLFFDEKLLTIKTITSTDLAFFNKSKFSLNYTPEQIILFLDLLSTDGYLSKSRKYEDSAIQYSITSKGVLKCFSDGFEKEKITRSKRKNLYDNAQVAVIIAAVYYSFEIVKQIKCFFNWILNIVFICN